MCDQFFIDNSTPPASRQSFSGSPSMRSPSIPIPPRKQKICRSASFSSTGGGRRCDSGVGFSAEVQSDYRSNHRSHSNRTDEDQFRQDRRGAVMDVPSVALTPVSPAEYGIRAGFRVGSSGCFSASPPRPRILWGDNEDSTEGASGFRYQLPPSPNETPPPPLPTTKKQLSEDAALSRRRKSGVNLPTFSFASADENDEEADAAEPVLKSRVDERHRLKRVGADHDEVNARGDGFDDSVEILGANARGALRGLHHPLGGSKNNFGSLCVQHVTERDDRYRASCVADAGGSLCVPLTAKSTKSTSPSIPIPGRRQNFEGTPGMTDQEDDDDDVDEDDVPVAESVVGREEEADFGADNPRSTRRDSTRRQFRLSNCQEDAVTPDRRPVIFVPGYSSPHRPPLGSSLTAWHRTSFLHASSSSISSSFLHASSTSSSPSRWSSSSTRIVRCDCALFLEGVAHICDHSTDAASPRLPTARASALRQNHDEVAFSAAAPLVCGNCAVVFVGIHEQTAHICDRSNAVAPTGSRSANAALPRTHDSRDDAIVEAEQPQGSDDVSATSRRNASLPRLDDEFVAHVPLIQDRVPVAAIENLDSDDDDSLVIVEAAEAAEAAEAESLTPPRLVQSASNLPDVVPRSERRSSFDLPVHFSVADRRVSLPLRFDAQHPMARRIGVELCRIADEIEALFVGDERRPAANEAAQPAAGADDELGAAAAPPPRQASGSNSAPAASAPAPFRRMSTLVRRFSDWNDRRRVISETVAAADRGQPTNAAADRSQSSNTAADRGQSRNAVVDRGQPPSFPPSPSP